MNKIFIAGPFTVALDSSNKFDLKTKVQLREIHDLVHDLGYEIFSAHIRESWGEEIDKPESLAKIDIEELRKCSHLIVYWGNTISVGVSIEIGLAIALKKPILLILDSDKIKSDFYLGLVQLDLIKEILFINQLQIKLEIKNFLK